MLSTVDQDHSLKSMAWVMSCTRDSLVLFFAHCFSTLFVGCAEASILFLAAFLTVAVLVHCTPRGWGPALVLVLMCGQAAAVPERREESTRRAPSPSTVVL